MFSFIFEFSDPNEKWVNKVMSTRILITDLHVRCFDVYAVPTYEH